MNQDSATPILCTCYGVSEAVVREAIESHHLKQIHEVTRKTKAGGGCYTCWPEIRDILREVHGEISEAEGAEEHRERVQWVLETEILPLFEKNHLQGRLMEIQTDRIYVEIRGERARPEIASVWAIREFMVARIQAVSGQNVEVQEVYVQDGAGGPVTTL